MECVWNGVWLGSRSTTEFEGGSSHVGIWTLESKNDQWPWVYNWMPYGTTVALASTGPSTVVDEYSMETICSVDSVKEPDNAWIVVDKSRTKRKAERLKGSWTSVLCNGLGNTYKMMSLGIHLRKSLVPRLEDLYRLKSTRRGLQKGFTIFNGRERKDHKLKELKDLSLE